MLLLAAAGILPLAATAGLALLALAQERREQTERAGLEVTRALATAIDVEIGRSIAVLQGIAVSPALDSADLGQFNDQVYGELLGIDEARRAELAANGII